ncbi:hypothetical protein OIU79_023897 [Salix purpurea]|uniref:Uncharacterized protein n=1 Tax=Salix purpurea TaxID=77065 RepID=A0A9Q1A9U4_SALPP|nr:hypothetical protein OIU79_023897 [Salix purpurea]
MDTPLSKDPIKVEVSYEWKPSRCNECKVYGHSCHPQPPLEPTSDGHTDELKEQEPIPTPVLKKDKMMVIPHEEPRSTTEASSSGVKQALAAAPLGAIACMERKLDSSQSQNLGDPSSEPQEFVADSTTTTDNDGKHASTKHVHQQDNSPTLSLKGSEEEEGGKEALRKQMAVQNWTQNNGLGIIGLIEPRLGVNSISEKIAGMGLQGWNFVDSESHPPRLLVIDKSPQWITCEVTGVGAQTTVTITFVYGHNKTDRPSSSVGSSPRSKLSKPNQAMGYSWGLQRRP